MDSGEIVEFSKTLIKDVRDMAIRSCDVQLHAISKDIVRSPIAKKYQELANTKDIQKFGEALIADAVDDTIFYLFHAIDNGIINVSITASNGKLINLTKEGLGELAGWYIGEWREKYSEERCNDYLDNNL